MRARVRHFQPKDAGANLVLDARYISQGNGTAVTSWLDRSGNSYNADQSTASRQPIYETAGVGGQGAVKFDGGDVLEIASGYTNLLSGDNTYSIMAITNLSSFSSQPVIVGQSTHFFLEYGNMSSVNYYYGQSSDFRTYGTTNTVMATNTSYIASFTKTAASSGTLYVNGTTQTSFTNTGSGLIATPSASANLILGGYTAAAGFAVSGYIPMALFFKTDLSDAMRKRVDHFAARSWKFSCN